MSTLNTILNKLGKIEELHETNLGKLSVSLGVKEDVSKFSQDSDKVIKSVGAGISDVDKAFDTITKNTKIYQSDKKQYDSIKKEYDFITGKLNQSTNDLKNNIKLSGEKIITLKGGQSAIKNIISKGEAIKRDIEQSAKELGIDAKGSNQYIKIESTLNNLDMLLEDSTQAIISLEREFKAAQSFIK